MSLVFGSKIVHDHIQRSLCQFSWSNIVMSLLFSPEITVSLSMIRNRFSLVMGPEIAASLLLVHP